MVHSADGNHQCSVGASLVTAFAAGLDGSFWRTECGMTMRWPSVSAAVSDTLLIWVSAQSRLAAVEVFAVERNKRPSAGALSRNNSTDQSSAGMTRPHSLVGPPVRPQSVALSLPGS
jgi:hypothetical protein